MRRKVFPPVREIAEGPAVELTDRQRTKLRYFKEALAYLCANYEACFRCVKLTLGWNDTFAAVRRMQRPRVGRTPFRARVHPGFEVLVNKRAAEFAEDAGRTAGKFGQREVELAAAELVSEFKPHRHRPKNTVLHFHVQGLMVLWRESTGRDIPYALKRNGNYDPHFPAPFDRILPGLFREVDQTTTATAVVDIMRMADRSGAIQGQRFRDYFPFFSPTPDAAGAPIPMPGHQTVSFERVEPIYVS